MSSSSPPSAAVECVYIRKRSHKTFTESLFPSERTNARAVIIRNSVYRHTKQHAHAKCLRTKWSLRDTTGMNKHCYSSLNTTLLRQNNEASFFTKQRIGSNTKKCFSSPLITVLTRVNTPVMSCHAHSLSHAAAFKKWYIGNIIGIFIMRTVGGDT